MSTPRAKPWAWFALVSVAINLFLAGMLVTRFVRRAPHDDMGPISMHGLAEAVDPSARPVVERVRDEHRDRMVAKMREAGEARRAAMEALTAGDFDEARARAAFDEFQQKSNEVQKEMHGSLIDLAKSLPPDQRVKMRDALGRRPHGRFGGPGHPREPPIGIGSASPVTSP
jgi:uncharacterized membrane protein